MEALSQKNSRKAFMCVSRISQNSSSIPLRMILPASTIIFSSIPRETATSIRFPGERNRSRTGKIPASNSSSRKRMENGRSKQDFPCLFSGVKLQASPGESAFAAAGCVRCCSPRFRDTSMATTSASIFRERIPLWHSAGTATHF
ncbi:hypothetical protein SDC9_151902 [bioreactor metagenome]|uniref:Uncharacterized protein n=1 Tax=bioreactor metagenome TaxID=1076179 RepID=A0A645ES58_9ZZZZ